jgi:hypothetical protein
VNISTQHHSFDILIAAKYGVEEAILIHHFMHWIRINTQANRNLKQFEIEGQKFQRYFTYQSRKEIQLHFPYWTYKQIRGITERLIAKGVLFGQHFSKSPIDHTLWYAFVNLDEFQLHRHQVAEMYQNSNNFAKGPNGQTSAQTGKSIKGTDTKSTDALKKKEREGTSPPATPPPLTFHYKRVEMDQKKYEKLCDEFTTSKIVEMMERLDEYADINPKRFKNYGCHGAVIRKWIREDKQKGSKNDSKGSRIDSNGSEGENISWMKEIAKQRPEIHRNGQISMNALFVEIRKINSPPLRIYYRDDKFKQFIRHELEKIGIIL